MRPGARLALAGSAAATALLLSPSLPAATAYSDRLVGTEIVPITSTLGTFAGVATGELPAAWRVQIEHEPLASGATVAITGGTFTLITRSRRALSGSVTAGSVTVLNRGNHCTNQTYRVRATFGIGSFEGTLTHHRRAILRHCVLYAATIRGTGRFSV